MKKSIRRQTVTRYKQDDGNTPSVITTTMNKYGKVLEIATVDNYIATVTTRNEYNDIGNIISNTNYDYTVSYIYDDDNKLLYIELNGKQVVIYEYTGNIRHVVYPTSESWTTYDERGNVVHYKDNHGSESWTEYDESDNQISFAESSGYHEKISYIDNRISEIIVCVDEECYVGLKVQYDDIGRIIKRISDNGDDISVMTVKYIDNKYIEHYDDDNEFEYTLNENEDIISIRLNGELLESLEYEYFENM